MVRPATSKTIENVKKKVLQVIFKYLPEDEYCVFLFGSQVSKNPFGTSDIDVGIIGRDKIDGGTLAAIKGTVNEDAKTLRKIDVVDFFAVEDVIFLGSALRRMEIWHRTPKSETYLNNLKKRLGD